MKALVSILAAFMVAVTMTGCDTSADKIIEEMASADVEYILVDFVDDISPQDVLKIERKFGIDVVPNSDMYSKTKLTRLKVDYSNRDRIEEIVNGLEDTDMVEAVEVEQIYKVIEQTGVLQNGEQNTSYSAPLLSAPNDPLYKEGKQWNMTMIGVEKAWETTHGEDVVVAVLDTGISTGKGKYPRVPDLHQTCMVEGRNFTRDGAKNDPYDYHGHGTHVGGTIAQSTNNGIGAVGVAFKACLMPVKVLGDNGSGSTAGIAEAIVWAVDNGAHVINMSLGGGGYSKVMDNALNYAVSKNVFVACAAGNNGGPRIEYPAAMDGCQAVSSVGKAGKLAFYSSYGTNGNGLFITAPGGDQRADGQEGGVWQNTIKTGDPTKHGYFPFQGTSMATPHVAGVAALVVSALPTEYTLDQVKDAMSSSATAMNDRAKYGSGLLNAEKAVSAAKNTDDSTDIPNLLEWFLGFLVLLGLVKAVRVSLSS